MPEARSLPLRHPALAPAAGSAVAAARLGDRQRLAVLLQAAALLAHLRHAGCSLADGFRSAVVAAGGRLSGVAVVAGGSREPPQRPLRELLAALFGADGAVAGRGDARRAARLLQQAWRDDLVPLPPDRMVADVLEACPFLWQERFAGARRALVATHRQDGTEVAWVCGPGDSRRRLLAVAGPGGEGVAALLASARARALWEGDGAATDEGLGTVASWRATVERYRRRPPRSGEQRIDLARSLYALGRFATALETLEGLRQPAARVLSAWCCFYLQRLQAARQRVRRLAQEQLPPLETVRAAELAVRLLANAGELAAVGPWVERARRAGGSEWAWRVELLAAAAAWDRGDLEAVAGHLEAARGALDHPAHAWRWHQVRGLAAFSAGDGAAMAAAAAEALRGSRRWLTVADAAGLWNDLAVGRSQADDRAGAERACAHGVRLLRRTEGPRKTTLAMRNLADLRLRRGSLAGVREILEEALVENRRQGNLRSEAFDAGLWARYELVQGRPLAALETCRLMLARLEAAGSDWHQETLGVLAARALGWLERPEEARDALEGAGERALAVLEPEERPALWCHAGDRETALAALGGTPLAPLWQAALTGATAPSGAWGALDGLEPYRTARAVWDLELAAPASVPPERLRHAIAVLRRVGAHPLAERLESRAAGAWEGLAAFLAEPEPDADALHRLFAAAGCGGVRLVVRREGRDEVLLEGPGGEEELVAPLVGGGYLVLAAPRLDAVHRALFRVVHRWLPRQTPPTAESGTAVPGLVGEGPALRRALVTLPRLADGEVAVMVLGESGTGKELVAKQVHRLSPRAAGPFLPLNCAELSETLILSELFGHVRGAFTGADRDRMGIFESARGGTVFLDEIGDLPPAAQGKLLRVLQEKEVRRVGESLPRKVDVRVVTATHRDLAAMVREGSFRQDLYYRLRVAVVELPPLRERGGDVLLLAEHFLQRRRAGRRLRLARDAAARLLAHGWPGNVRELENVLEVAAALAEEGVIEERHLPLAPAEDGASQGGYHQQVEAFRRRLVEEALAAVGGRQAEAARRLGLTRQALSYLVRQLKVRKV
ncbi:MAG TPA: sigma 54-interacting transcriptional regulator [Thermoanaerobaculia bacterium]|nr:sigma 54-interacting transcriptional regulator [Thermoanaerobaculia bacterium]